MFSSQEGGRFAEKVAEKTQNTPRQTKYLLRVKTRLSVDLMRV